MLSSKPLESLRVVKHYACNGCTSTGVPLLLLYIQEKGNASSLS